MKKIAVVILNWNGRKLLEQFLPSVIQHTNPEIAEVIVADNASSDESIDFLQTNYPEIQRILLDQNYGFAGGYNRALQELPHPYFVLLNSDVEVAPNWLEPLLELAESNSNIAAIQPKLKAWHNKNEFEYAGAAGGFIDYLGYPFCQGRILNQLEEDHNQFDEIKDIFWASGAALFIRGELYKKLGGLDTDFFAHMEEIDLCWRLKNRGYQIAYHPKSTVYHLGGGTLPMNHPRKLFLNFRNNLLMLYKNLPQNRLISTMFRRMIMDGVAAMKFLLSFEFSNFAAVFKAHMSFYKMLPAYQQKRNQLLPFVKQNFHKEIYPDSMIIAFFLKKQKYFSQLKWK
ncbi:MAG: glycosyltransferase family 2 protein [Marinifilaceae bacterium]